METRISKLGKVSQRPYGQKKWQPVKRPKRIKTKKIREPRARGSSFNKRAYLVQLAKSMLEARKRTSVTPMLT